MHPLINILGSPDTFLDSTFNQIETTGIHVESLDMDHICYRVEENNEYFSIQTLLLQHGSLLSDKIIGGRPISVIELNEPYCYNDRKINIIELPSPKEGSQYSTGYEHVEFVVELNLEDFIKSYPSMDFDLKGMNKEINRDVRLQLDGCSVKFHEHSLKHVIEVLEN